MKVQRVLFAGGLYAAVVLGACGGGEKGGTTDSAAADAQAGGGGAPAASGFSTTELTPDAGGKVITVEMETDAQGNNKFEPAEVTAKKGDVVRYKLETGVHNVHFVADSNAGAQGLPAQPSDMLQLPGQTVELKVSSAPGKYFFQCDPHALLGMVGHLTVAQ